MINTIEQTIKTAGLGKKKVMQKQIEMFQKKFEANGEELLGACANVKGTQQLFVTNKQVTLHLIKGLFGNDEKSIPLSSINSINISTKLVYSELEIITSGNKASIEGVPSFIATEIKNLIESLKSEASSSTQQVATNDDSIEQLTKLKSLLDAGILTQEEFDTKKKQILGI